MSETRGKASRNRIAGRFDQWLDSEFRLGPTGLERQSGGHTDTGIGICEQFGQLGKINNGCAVSFRQSCVDQKQ